MKPLAPLPAAPRLTPSEQRYPLYSFRVPAGFPSPAQDHIENTLSLDELMGLRAPHVYLVRAQGDSMTGAGIFDGDILVVDRAAEAANGAVVIAALNGEPLVKLLEKQGGQIVLRSANPRYAPRYVIEGDELHIWGVVRYSVHAHGIV
ncbi:LexA family protein [Azotobacter vinelandii]|uniref:LexA family protein n=1 Tax=Azotobacter vinelandii TaxID=354 RepID=UPI000772DA06|nr:S24 family peptidase [Azotobacter vinelandii]